MLGTSQAKSVRLPVEDLRTDLDAFAPTLDELRAGGGGRTEFVRRFDESLVGIREEGEQVWGKQNITIQKNIGLDGDMAPVSRVRGHEIDMFGFGSLGQPLPGVAIQPERIDGIESVFKVRGLLDQADQMIAPGAWRSQFESYEEAWSADRALREEALALLPPVSE